MSKKEQPKYLLQDLEILEDESKIKFMHISDTHLGYNHSSFINNPNTNINLKIEDLERSLEYCVNLAIKSKVDFILHTGDLFHIARPNFSVILNCMHILQELEKYDIPFIVIAGNHDRAYSITTKSPIDLLQYVKSVSPISDHASVYIPCKGKTVRIVGITYQIKEPSVKINTFIKELNERDKSEPPADYNILMIHQTLKAGNKGGFFMVEDEPLDENDLPTDFDYIACGHIHLQQQKGHPLKEDLPIAYAGSTEKVTFGEFKEIKQGWFGILDKGCQISSFVIPTREMRELVIEFKNPKTSLVVEETIQKALSQVQNDSLFLGVYFKGEISQEFTMLLTTHKFRRLFPTQAALAFYQKNLTLISPQGEKVSYDGKWINSDEKELELALSERKDITKDRLERLMDLGKEIISESRGE